MDGGVYAETVEGTPQGAGLSPMRLVRFADDFLLTFERRADAEAMLAALSDRLAKFGLQLHDGHRRDREVLQLMWASTCRYTHQLPL